MFLVSKVLCQHQANAVCKVLATGTVVTDSQPAAAKVQILSFDWYFVNSLLVVLQPKYFGSSHCLALFHECSTYITKVGSSECSMQVIQLQVKMV